MLLPDQDRSRWDAGLGAEGQQLVRACLRRNAPGPYKLQAAIAAVHSDAATAAAALLAVGAYARAITLARNAVEHAQLVRRRARAAPPAAGAASAG